jgi:hypothetical protein
MVQGSDGVNDLYQLQVGQSEGNGDLMLMSRHIWERCSRPRHQNASRSQAALSETVTSLHRGLPRRPLRGSPD